jgi:TorA maturation chaperone TorD
MISTKDTTAGKIMATTKDSLHLAAQADLVLLTAEMFRPSNPLQIAQGNAWWQTPIAEYLWLVKLATSADASTKPTSGFKHLDAEQLPTLEEALAEVHQLGQSTNVDCWNDEYCRLFDGSQACPLNQASYIRRDKGTILGDLAGFYAAFGWKNNPANGERPDHLVTQIEFIGMLLAMSAQTHDDQQREVVHAAMAEFAKLHMHDWLPSVCKQMTESTQLAYFGALAQWLMVLWVQLTLEHDWSLDGVEQAIHAPNIDPEDPYECGAPDLVNISLQKT